MKLSHFFIEHLLKKSYTREKRIVKRNFMKKFYVFILY